METIIIILSGAASLASGTLLLLGFKMKSPFIFMTLTILACIPVINTVITAINAVILFIASIADTDETFSKQPEDDQIDLNTKAGRILYFICKGKKL